MFLELFKDAICLDYKRFEKAGIFFRERFGGIILGILQVLRVLGEYMLFWNNNFPGILMMCGMRYLRGLQVSVNFWKCDFFSIREDDYEIEEHILQNSVRWDVLFE